MIKFKKAIAKFIIFTLVATQVMQAQAQIVVPPNLAGMDAMTRSMTLIKRNQMIQQGYSPNSADILSMYNEVKKTMSNLSGVGDSTGTNFDLPTFKNTSLFGALTDALGINTIDFMTSVKNGATAIEVYLSDAGSTIKNLIHETLQGITANGSTAKPYWTDLTGNVITDYGVSNAQLKARADAYMQAVYQRTVQNCNLVSQSGGNYAYSCDEYLNGKLVVAGAAVFFTVQKINIPNCKPNEILDGKNLVCKTNPYMPATDVSWVDLSSFPNKAAAIAAAKTLTPDQLKNPMSIVSLTALYNAFDEKMRQNDPLWPITKPATTDDTGRALPYDQLFPTASDWLAPPATSSGAYTTPPYDTPENSKCQFTLDCTDPIKWQNQTVTPGWGTANGTDLACFYNHNCPWYSDTTDTGTGTTDPASSTTTDDTKPETDPGIALNITDEAPTVSSIMDPIFNLLDPSLTNFQMGSHSSECPKPTFNLFGKQITMTIHCDLAQQIGPQMKAVFMVIWSITAILIVLGA